MGDAEKLLLCIEKLERMKYMTRYNWTSEGSPETIADHSWRAATMALLLSKHVDSSIDTARVIEMLLIHDLGEILEGDISAKYETDSNAQKLEREQKAMNYLFDDMPREISEYIYSLWNEYNEGKSREGCLAKAIDKMETIIQHNQGKLPNDFDFEFNLDYGSQYSRCDELIIKLREIVDNKTRSNIK